MRELLYAVYKNLYYRLLIAVSFSEALIKNIGIFKNGDFVVERNSYLTKSEIKILSRISIVNEKRIYLSDYKNWMNELAIYSFKTGYLKKYPLLGIKYTRYFKNKLRQYKKKQFSKDIVSFIDSGKIEFLKNIYANIQEIKFPFCKEIDEHAWTEYYYDKNEMLDEAVAQQFGSFHYVNKKKEYKYKR